MSKVTILCKTPGFRRLGLSHPATATYDPDRWTADDIAILKSDPNFNVIVDRSEAAPIPGTVPASGVIGDASFLIGLTGVFDTFLQQLDVRLERVFGRGDDARADFATAFGASATPNRGLDSAEAFVLAPLADVAAVVQPAAVAPGADVSDAVQDNGAGPAVNDLGAKSMGVAEAAPVQTGSGITPPVFDDARIQSIRAALKDFAPDVDLAGRAAKRRLREALGFEPSAAEIAAARIEAVAPEAIVTT